VRLLVGDIDLENQIFDDDSISAFLSLEDSDIRLAAAQALDTIGSSQVYILKVTSTLDLTTDGAAVSRELRQRANALRDQVKSGTGDMTGMIDWAEEIVDDFSYRQRVWNQGLRNAG
jgi:hypothetical protein